MSKYDGLWAYVAKNGGSLKLTFEEIKAICGAEIDHSFLNYKKELSDYGYRVVNISLKNKYIVFEKI